MEVRNINGEFGALNKAKAYRIPGKCSSCAQNNVSFKGVNGIQKGLKWISNNFSSPHQRAILGITALCTQPLIDLHNRHIKKEDKPIAVAKTIAKILVGTTIGICLRYFAIKAVKNFTLAKKVGKYSQCLLPKNIVKKLASNPKSVSKMYLENYRNGLGTFLGVMGGLFTNFLIDAPLSKMMTNFIYERFMKKEKANG